MSKENYIDIYFVDDDVLYLNYFRKKFQLDLPHNLHTYSTGKTFLRHFVSDTKKRKNQNIVILDYLLQTGDEADSKSSMELLPVIKNNDPEAEVIILSGKVNLSVLPTAGNYTPAAFIKKDRNEFEHISSLVKRLASKYELNNKQSQSRFATNLFIILFVVAVIITILMLFIYS